MKALRRLESDKSSRVQRPLREEVVRGREARRRSPALIVGAGVFVTGLAIGAGMLLFWPGKVPKDSSAGAPIEVAGATPEARASAAPSGRRPAARPRRVPSRPSAAPAADRGQGGTPARRSALDRRRVARPLNASAEEPDVAVVRRIEPPPLAVREGDAAEEPRLPRPGETRPGASALRASKPKPSSVASAGGSSSTAATPEAAPSVPAPVAPEATPSVPEPAAPEATPSVPAPVAPEPVRVASRPEAAKPPEPKPAPAAAPPSSVAPSAVPIILVSSTHWHPSPGRREAVIEVGAEGDAQKRRVREGDAVGPLRVEKIEPSGVVFDYDGNELRHAVSSD
jgi:hypothetical protein